MLLHVFFGHNIVDAFAASVTNLQVAGGPVCRAAEGGGSGPQGLGSRSQLWLVLGAWVWMPAAQALLIALCFRESGDAQCHGRRP